MVEEKNKEEKSNLPVVSNDKFLKVIPKRAITQIADIGRKVFKIAGAGAIAITGLGMSALNIPIIGAIGIGTFIGASARLGTNIIYKTEPGLMFMSRKKASGERQIYQDTRISLARHMRDFSAGEKASMMGLQMLVGFSRYKESLKGSPSTEREDGTKVYNQRYSTVTHTVNLKNFQMLENLGLIEIESMNEITKNNGMVARIFGKEPKLKTSLLIPEKVGFRNWESLKEIAKARISRDQETLERNTVTPKKIVFKLTDKPIDFEDMYLKINGAREFESRKEKTALRRFFGIFAEKRGILSKTGIEIKKDALGRDTLIYNSKSNFSERMSTELEKGRVSLACKDESNQKRIRELNEQFLENTNSALDETTLDEINDVGHPRVENEKQISMSDAIKDSDDEKSERA